MSGHPAPVRVALTTLALKDFRNYSALRATFPSTLIALAGPNGAGKTNLLEAISLLTPGRGLRRSPFEAITRQSVEDGWAVAATLDRGGEEVRLGAGLLASPTGDDVGRRIRINGATASGAEALLDYLRILWLTPAMDGLFTGPASERRKFLDRLVLAVDPGHGANVRDMERLLAQRNRLLEQHGAAAWLEAVEAQLAEKAVAVAIARGQTVGLLSRRIGEPGEPEAAFPESRLRVIGEFDAGLEGRTAAEAELAYRALLADNRPADRVAGRTRAGPHRSDLEVIFARKDMPAALSSTGEQKALLIGLILGHAEIVAEISGMTPLLLLDEVVAHLDPERRAALFGRLGGLGFQSFMTGTDPVLFASSGGEAARFEVADGTVRPIG
jgi:DNA replication and repair protein RecF